MPSEIDSVTNRDPNEKEFHQAVREVAESVMPYIEKNPIYKKHKILERIAEPERVVMFRVPWLDDNGEIQINRGFRIQMNSAIGPYKGVILIHLYMVQLHCSSEFKLIEDFEFR